MPRFLGGLRSWGCPFDVLAWPPRQPDVLHTPAILWLHLLYIYNSSFYTHAHTYLHCFRIIKVQYLKRGQMSLVIEKCNLKSYTPTRTLIGGTLSIGETMKQLDSHHTHQGINPVTGGNYVVLTCGSRARAALGTAVPLLLYS